MEGSVRNAKRMISNGETSGDANVDRLSNLPEELIAQIMSLLPMEDAIKTEALSTTWRYRWTKMTHIEMYDYYVHSMSMKMIKKEQFLLHIERVLILLGHQEIKSFSLECLRQHDAAQVHTWITALITRHVEKVRVICSEIKGQIAFPLCAFDSMPLREVHLNLVCSFRLPTSFCFSSLRILSLSEISFQNMGFPDSLSVTISFPLLHQLSLRGCSWENVQFVTIEAPILEIFNFGDFEVMYEPKHIFPYDCFLRIQGSKLRKFNCGSHSYVYLSLENSLSVTAATIGLASILLKREYTMGYLSCALLRQLPRLKSLTLSSKTILAFSHLENLDAHLPQLDRILHLTISDGTPEISESLITLLGRLPRLKSLTIKTGNMSDEDDTVHGFNKECSLPRLKVVRFKSIYGRNDELELAKFIMKNATSLDEVTLTARGRRKNKEQHIMRAKEELLNFPRASVHAVVKFDQIEGLSWDAS